MVAYHGGGFRGARSVSAYRAKSKPGREPEESPKRERAAGEDTKP
jgi:hypothetical protein